MCLYRGEKKKNGRDPQNYIMTKKNTHTKGTEADDLTTMEKKERKNARSNGEVAITIETRSSTEIVVAQRYRAFLSLRSNSKNSQTSTIAKIG